MNILKILGIVVAVHLVAFFLMFVNPGCRATTQRPAPASTEAAPAGDAGPGAPAGLASAPATPVAADTGAPPAVHYSPTRPGTPAAAALESAPPADVTPATTYAVAPGDSLWKIAKKHGTTVAELQKANRLTGNSKLSVGQKLIIPGRAPAARTGATATYTVEPGDTLSSIAHRVGSTTADLMRLNKLRSEYVRVGQELQMPSGAASRAEETPAPAATAATAPAPVAPAAAPVKRPDGSMIHVVKTGETLGAIARKYRVKVADLAVANNIADPKKIRPGQELIIPGLAAVNAAPAVTGTPPVFNPPGANPPDNPAPPATPPSDQDLDAGLKPQGNVPVIKVDDDAAKKSP